MNLNVKRLTVKYNQKTVGYLEAFSEKKIGFQYDRDWVQNGFSISPFSLPLSDQVYQSKGDYFDGLFGVFHNSLPDAWGRLLVQKYLYQKGIDVKKVSILTQLTLLSSSAMGGLTYHPNQDIEDPSYPIDLDAVSNDISHLFAKTIAPEKLDRMFEWGGASGGARPKVLIHYETAEWIVKFPAPTDPLTIGQLEYEANQKAEECGIEVSKYALFPSEKSPGYFGSKRFDRNHHQNVHMISLSALLETSHTIPNLDYTHLFQVIQHISNHPGDLIEAYKRMVFNVLYGNKDDHGKNVSFMYDEDLKGYRLTPFYDITQTRDKPEHEMTVLGEGNPREADLIQLAKRFKLPLKTCESIINTTKNVLQST